MRRDIFQAIADPNRRAIIGLLANKKLTVNEVAEHFRVSRPAISKHIKILSECGLVTIWPRGRERYVEGRLHRLREVVEWSAQYRKFWSSKLDNLEDFLAREPNSKKGKKK